MTVIDRLLRREEDEPLQEDEWERETAAQKTLLGLFERREIEEHEIGPGRSEVHWAPRRPRATTDPPTSPGFYARRARLTAYWSVVEVLPDGKGNLWWVQSPRDPVRLVKRDELYEWSDSPLVMPR